MPRTLKVNNHWFNLTNCCKIDVAFHICWWCGFLYNTWVWREVFTHTRFFIVYYAFHGFPESFAKIHNFKKIHLGINSSFISSMHISLLFKNFMAQRVSPSLGGTIKNITPSFYILIIRFFLKIKNLMIFFSLEHKFETCFGIFLGKSNLKVFLR